MTLPRLAVFLAALALSVASAWAQAVETAQMSSEAAKAIIATGPLGAIFVLYVALSATVIWALWRKSSEGETTIKELQEKRLSDTASYIEKIAKSGSDASAAITGNNAQVADLSRLINAIYDLLKTVPPAISVVKEETGLNRGRVEALSDLIRDRMRGEK